MRRMRRRRQWRTFEGLLHTGQRTSSIICRGQTPAFFFVFSDAKLL